MCDDNIIFAYSYLTSTLQVHKDKNAFYLVSMGKMRNFLICLFQ